jgi:hypothetical protein
MVIEGMSWSKESYSVLGIEGHKEHERTLTQSERAQKVLVEFGLITCESQSCEASASHTDSLGSQLSADSPHGRWVVQRNKMAQECGNEAMIGARC